MKQPTWHDILRERHNFEDSKIARFYSEFKDLGAGHLRKVPLMERKTVRDE